MESKELYKEFRSAMRSQFHYIGRGRLADGSWGEIWIPGHSKKCMCSWNQKTEEERTNWFRSIWDQKKPPKK